MTIQNTPFLVACAALFYIDSKVWVCYNTLNLIRI